MTIVSLHATMVGMVPQRAPCQLLGTRIDGGKTHGAPVQQTATPGGADADTHALSLGCKFYKFYIKGRLPFATSQGRQGPSVPGDSCEPSCFHNQVPLVASSQ